MTSETLRSILVAVAVAFGLVGCVTAPEPVQPDEVVEPEIERAEVVPPDDVDPLALRYILASGIDEQIETLLAAAVGAFKKELQDVPEAFWVEFTNNVNRDEMFRAQAALVQEQFSKEELKELVVFFESDLGVKYVEARGKLREDYAQQMAAWGRKVQADLTFELKLKGYM